MSEENVFDVSGYVTMDAALGAANDELRRLRTENERLQSQLTATTKQIEEARKDTARLEWLQNGSNGSGNGVLYSITNGEKIYIVSGGIYSHKHGNVRKAIDAAMATKTKGGGL